MEDQGIKEDKPFWEIDMEDASRSYLKKQRDCKLESILMFCLLPQNFNSYGYLADIIVNIMEERNKRLMKHCEERQQKNIEYRKRIQAAKERAKINNKDCIV